MLRTRRLNPPHRDNLTFLSDSPTNLKEWPGGDRATLAIVFTDILASTALTKELGDESMKEVREDHFSQGEKFLQQFEGRLIKKIGDSLMVAFKSVDSALDFSRRFHSNPGHPRVQIRAGIHVGSMDVSETDVDGHNVNLAARVAHAIQDAEIWLSNEAKSDLDHLKPERFRHLTWTPHQVTPKGLATTTFWSLTDPNHVTSPIPAAIPAPVRTFTAKLPTVDTLLIGRDPELAFLEKAWTESAKIVQIIAPGGTGKTALMDKWFRRHLNEVTIFGWSFYSQGSKQDRQTSSDPFFAEILTFFDITIKEGASVWARAEAIAARLRKERVLLILDGMEPLQESTGELRDSPLKALLQELRTHNAGMVLCTTRVRIKELPDDEQCRSCNLENLSPKDGARLLEHLGVKGTPEELENASSDYGNHALALTLLGTYLRDFRKGDIRRRAEIRGLFTEETDADGHANRVMASYVTKFEGKPELQVLRALGYFDRPAEPEAIRLVLPKMEDQKYHAALVRLNKARLILTSDPSEELDCHPLVREYFASTMRAAEEFGKGHRLLYEHYCENGPHQPDTRQDMVPLFYAVYHGCQAGLHKQALEEIYRARILRGKKFHLISQLGEFGTNLSILASFFATPWTEPVQSLSVEYKSWLIGEAAFTLRALGRLADAVAPMNASAEARVNGKDWRNASVIHGNLSELYLSLGSLTESMRVARKHVTYADQSQDELQRYVARATLASVHHQLGNIETALPLFEEAERLQAKHFYPILYSLPGYLYSDLLLDEGRNEVVIKRTEETLKIAKANFGPLHIGLDHLTLGRAHEPGSLESRHHLIEAIKCIRHSGYLDYLARALLACPTDSELEEAFAISYRSQMPLHLADYHLIKAGRLRSQDHFKKADAIIRATGYHRRDPVLQVLRAKVFF